MRNKVYLLLHQPGHYAFSKNVFWFVNFTLSFNRNYYDQISIACAVVNAFRKELHTREYLLKMQCDHIQIIYRPHLSKVILNSVYVSNVREFFCVYRCLGRTLTLQKNLFYCLNESPDVSKDKYFLLHIKSSFRCLDVLVI